MVLRRDIMILLWSLLSLLSQLIPPTRGTPVVSSIFNDNFELTPNPPNDVSVGAYYYPWHKPHFQITQEGYVRRSLYPRQEIRLGEYDDTQPEVITQHLNWSKRANINVWITSWWGPGTNTDTTIRDVILPHPGLARNNHKVALLYETTGRIKESEEYDIHRLVEDMKYICVTMDYLNHPNYFTVHGRPVMVVYLTRAMERVGKLTEIIRIIRDNCPKIYIIGDQIWGEAPDEALDDLDAITNYDVYGNMGKPRFAGQGTVDEYYRKVADWKAHAIQHNTSFVPCVSPGFNDRGVRLETNNPAMSRRLDENSAEGSLFAAQLVQATKHLDPTVDNLLLVNSFNEWHEDSQIEPVDGKSTTTPEELTQGLEYVGYGTLYLDILRTYTRNDGADALQENGYNHDLPIHFTGTPYGVDNILLAAFYCPSFSYSWFAEDHFDHGLRANLEPNQYLIPSTSYQIDRDLLLSWQSNIRVWVMPWYRPNHITDSRAASVVSDSNLIESVQQIALYYYPYFRILDDGHGSWDTAAIESDARYICQNYFMHKNYLKTSSTSKPVLLLGMTRVLHDIGSLSLVVDAIRRVARDDYGLDLYVFGDQVWGQAPTESGYEPFQILDAVLNKELYGNMGQPRGYAGQQQVDSYYEEQRKWRIAAWKEGCSYLPTVIPGYNDRASRFLRDNPALSRRLNETDGEGTFFEACLDKAKHLLDDELGDMMLINSFNHFESDTQIYPVYGATTDLPNNLTQGLSYEGYGETYLDLLTSRFGYFDPTTSTVAFPSSSPSSHPSEAPSSTPSTSPSSVPTPSPFLSSVPTEAPSNGPSKSPVKAPAFICVDDPGWQSFGENPSSCKDIHDRIYDEEKDLMKECGLLGADGNSAFEACPETCQQDCNSPPLFVSKRRSPLGVVFIIIGICFILFTLVIVCGFCHPRVKEKNSDAGSKGLTSSDLSMTHEDCCDENSIAKLHHTTESSSLTSIETRPFEA